MEDIDFFCFILTTSSMKSEAEMRKLPIKKTTLNIINFKEKILDISRVLDQ